MGHMTKIKIATWNINSVRLRAPIVADFINEAAPDILCLQEIKCQTAEFPSKVLKDLGYNHFVIRGQKGWHGVAIASKIPLTEVEEPKFCMHDHARVAAAKIGDSDIIIHNLYVPAGGDIPDVTQNDKFAHKLDFLAQMDAFYKQKQAPYIVVGDLNIAPHEHDVWSHKALLDVVSHTPIETETLEKLRIDGGLLDIARIAHNMDEKLYSWWSYRSADWTKNNRGRRLDHIWVSDVIGDKFVPQSYKIHTHARSWVKPSDHVPITIEMEI